MHRREDVPEKALAQAANELDSDTDTIATMAGAILGSCAQRAPEWHIQDRDYIVYEASRLARIAAGQSCNSFAYPDLARWSPPANQLAAVGTVGDKVALVGLGSLEKIDETEYRSGDSVWQWYRLPFGQTVLVKRRVALPALSPDQMPGISTRHDYAQAVKTSSPQSGQSSLLFEESGIKLAKEPKQDARYLESENWSLDRATDYAIRANFAPEIVGTLFNHCLDETESIEQVVAFAAILGKAKLARRRKRDGSK